MIAIVVVLAFIKGEVNTPEEFWSMLIGKGDHAMDLVDYGVAKFECQRAALKIQR